MIITDKNGYENEKNRPKNPKSLSAAHAYQPPVKG